MLKGGALRLRRAFSFPAPVALKGFPPVRYKSSETTKHTDDMWVQRLSTGLYRVGVTKKLTDSLGGIGFVDICAEGSILTSGKPFGMVEGPSGTFTVSSPISGEVIECNEILKKNPTVLKESPEDPERSWIIELDSACDFEDEEVDWIKIAREKETAPKSNESPKIETK
mmetsp:Transcript_31967/g.44579  ORF Transcript_31967/g.44579 Transcript_31967/m.44579 type:complete len:169 (+) Transcript_31967:46-552(+)